MRTTVDLDKPLLERAKRRAAREGRTLSALVREAVGGYLAAPEEHSEEPFEVITCGRPGGYAPTPAEMARDGEKDDPRMKPGSEGDADA